MIKTPHNAPLYQLVTTVHASSWCTNQVATSLRRGLHVAGTWYNPSFCLCLLVLNYGRRLRRGLRSGSRRGLVSSTRNYRGEMTQQDE